MTANQADAGAPRPVQTAGEDVVGYASQNTIAMTIAPQTTAMTMMRIS